MSTVFIASGPRRGQFIRVDLRELPELITFPDPPEGNGETIEGVPVLKIVEPDSPDSTTYRVFSKGGPDCPPMYGEVGD
jgi:hypothetical protein